MKILLITMEYPPDRGGVGNYYFNLVKNLYGHQIEVLKADRSSFYKFFWPKWLKLYFKVKQQVKKNKPDLIWVGQVLPIGTVAYLIEKFFKIPYFVSTHGMDIMLPQRSARKEKLMMKILEQAKFLTANSQFTRNQMVKLGISEDKVEVIYPAGHIKQTNEVGNKERVERLKKSLKLEGKKVLLTVGRLVERKGQDLVIKALPRLLENLPDLVYLIIGSGPYRKNLESEVNDLKLNQKVIFVSNASDEDLGAYYQLADAFVMPTRDVEGDIEGFGIVYLEAMSFGLPVVAGRSGGVPEVVIDGQTGLLVNPTNISDISQKIFEVLADIEKSKELVKKGQAKILEEFNWPKQTAKLMRKI